MLQYHIVSQDMIAVYQHIRYALWFPFGTCSLLDNDLPIKILLAYIYFHYAALCSLVPTKDDQECYCVLRSRHTLLCMFNLDQYSPEYTRVFIHNSLAQIIVTSGSICQGTTELTQTRGGDGAFRGAAGIPSRLGSHSYGGEPGAPDHAQGDMRKGR